MAAASSPMTKLGNGISFDCGVCLGSLDAPSSIDSTPAPAAALYTPGPPQSGSSGMILRPMHPFGSRRGTAIKRGEEREGRRKINNATISGNLAAIVSTRCGHMYHNVCLLKWFREQGKQTCPNCGKIVPSTGLTRLFPSRSPDYISDNCTKPECRDLKDRHSLLMNDYKQLTSSFNDLRDDNELKQIQINILEEYNERKAVDISQIKREIEETHGKSYKNNSPDSP